MYATGRGVRQDEAEAIRFYRLAAAQNEATARQNLTALCNSGIRQACQ